MREGRHWTEIVEKAESQVGALDVGCMYCHWIEIVEKAGSLVGALYLGYYRAAALSDSVCSFPFVVKSDTDWHL